MSSLMEESIFSDDSNRKSALLEPIISYEERHFKAALANITESSDYIQAEPKENLRMGTGIGSKCSGGWMSNTKR